MTTLLLFNTAVSLFAVLLIASLIIVDYRERGRSDLGFRHFVRSEWGVKLRYIAFDATVAGVGVGLLVYLIAI